MAFLNKLLQRFARAPAGSPAAEGVRAAAVIEEMKSRALPCLRLRPGGNGSSRLGGAPEMTVPWPRFQGRPMTFVALLDLPTMHAAGGPDWLPAEGRLLFFYDLEHGAWGFDPKDAGSFAVLHQTEAAPLAAEPDDLAEELRFPAYPVTFVADHSLPDESRLDINWRNMSKAEQAALEKAVEALAPQEPAHQVGGYPGPIQNDGMELQCQLASAGVYVGNAKGYEDKRVAGLKVGTEDWRLLLQLDTDEAAGMMWGDTGRLYVWIPEPAARTGDFSKAWVILQCF
jgi:uncharacterized protein YwqG